MIGRILNHNYTTKAYTAGEALAYGQAVYLDTDNKVKKITDATKPVLGFVARTEHDKSDTIALDDTVTVLSQGEIKLKTSSGLTLTGITTYNATLGELSVATGALKLYGVQAIAKLADTEAHVRVGGAITVTA